MSLRSSIIRYGLNIRVQESYKVSRIYDTLWLISGYSLYPCYYVFLVAHVN